MIRTEEKPSSSWSDEKTAGVVLFALIAPGILEESWLGLKLFGWFVPGFPSMSFWSGAGLILLMRLFLRNPFAKDPKLTNDEKLTTQLGYMFVACPLILALAWIFHNLARG